ncbi:hypothetical protein [Streptomyces zaomyceticus]|uniref:hypothetical protein n=1 Tax=Streptomyces zaomyceticus TaxID=68286 RepID=UPI00342662C2
MGLGVAENGVRRGLRGPPAAFWRAFATPGAGLTAVVSVKPDQPEFSGSTRGVLGGAAVRAGGARAVRTRLGTRLEGHPEQAAAMVGRITHGTRQD